MILRLRWSSPVPLEKPSSRKFLLSLLLLLDVIELKFEFKQSSHFFLMFSAFKFCFEMGNRTQFADEKKKVFPHLFTLLFSVKFDSLLM